MKEIILKDGLVALVDDADFEDLNQFNWYLETNGYVRGWVRGQIVSMHRYLLGLAKGVRLDVDHVNGIRHDNQQKNLRACTRSQNLGNQRLKPQNTSGFKGVSWDKKKNKWMAKITKNGKQIYLGRFVSADLAHAAYCKAAGEKFGEFANDGSTTMLTVQGFAKLINGVEAFGAQLGVQFGAQGGI